MRAEWQGGLRLTWELPRDSLDGEGRPQSAEQCMWNEGAGVDTFQEVQVRKGESKSNYSAWFCFRMGRFTFREQIWNEISCFSLCVFFLLTLISSGCLNIGQEHCGICTVEYRRSSDCWWVSAIGSRGAWWSGYLDLPSLYRLAPNVWGYSHRTCILDMLVNITASWYKRKGQWKNKVIRELLWAINWATIDFPRIW